MKFEYTVNKTVWHDSQNRKTQYVLSWFGYSFLGAPVEPKTPHVFIIMHFMHNKLQYEHMQNH